MNRYPSSTPRAACGLAAIVMTALTLGVAVILPATMTSGSQRAGTVAAKGGAPAAAEVAVVPGRIRVLGVRESNLTVEAVPAEQPARKQRG